MVDLVPRSVRELFYITHIENIPSILSRGIYSHEKVESEGIDYTPIYDENIVSRRKGILLENGKSLWSYANLFYNPRNPMLFRVTREKPINDLAVIGIHNRALDLRDVLISDGNAAHHISSIFPLDEKLLLRIVNKTRREWWNDIDGSKRKIMAECLVPDSVPPALVRSIYVASHEAKQKVDKMLDPFSRDRLTIAPEPYMFFQPVRTSVITELLSVVQGDMFFSTMQTLTVSVNCVGVMGKGVASRAKYMFSDVFSRYEHVCRTKRLKLGKPYLYRREATSDEQLSDYPPTIDRSRNRNAGTWFLLYPTKDHWRGMASFRGIEEGLEWLCANYKRQGIQSLALPALGCGLGGLDWREVGPLLCRYLKTMNIQVMIYLPLEKKIPDEYISSDFLLGRDKSKQHRLH